MYFKDVTLGHVWMSLSSLSHTQAVTLPLSVSDGKWHHVCVTWSTRDGQWEAYQDGVQRGSGMNLSPWRPIRPGGVFILGQEQVKTIYCIQIEEVIYFEDAEKPVQSNMTCAGEKVQFLNI